MLLLFDTGEPALYKLLTFQALNLNPHISSLINNKQIGGINLLPGGVQWIGDSWLEKAGGELRWLCGV
jgi:hypothetical protein